MQEIFYATLVEVHNALSSSAYVYGVQALAHFPAPSNINDGLAWNKDGMDNYESELHMLLEQ